jgi:hypothetical protein
MTWCASFERRACAKYRELNELLGPDGRLRPEFTYDNTHLTARAYAPWVASVLTALDAR